MPFSAQLRLTVTGHIPILLDKINILEITLYIEFLCSYKNCDAFSLAESLFPVGTSGHVDVKVNIH
jgi:hypothetical protein